MPFPLFGRKETPAPAAPSEPKAPGGFFTSDVQHMAGDPGARWQNALSRSIQKAMPRATDGSGMDDSSTGISPLKLGFYAGMPEAQALWYASQGFIGHNMCALLAQHWLIDKACTMPARDAIRMGYELSLPDGVDDERLVKEVQRLDRKFNINGSMREYVRAGRIFGIRVAIFQVESTDAEYYEKPFNLDGVAAGSYRGIVQVDPTWCSPVFSDGDIKNPDSKNFYNPTWWLINGRKYHRSHLAIFVPYPVTDTLKPTYGYGGVSVPQRIYERVYAAERTANEAPQLAMTKRTTILKTDAAAALADETRFIEKLAIWCGLRDNYGVKVIDKEGEDISQIDTSLTDLDTVIMTQYQVVAAAANVPATKLLGTTPKGFNATGEYEESSYHEELESMQTHDLSPLLSRHHMLLMRSEIAPRLGISPVHIDHSWKPLDSPTAGEWADINLKKAQAAVAYAGVGAIDGQDIRDQLKNDKDSDFYNLADPVELTEPTGMDGALLVGVNEPVSEEEIDACIRMGDFVVKVSPEYAGRRIVISGHAALAAARQVGAEPVFVECDGHSEEVI